MNVADRNRISDGTGAPSVAKRGFHRVNGFSSAISPRLISASALSVAIQRETSSGETATLRVTAAAPPRTSRYRFSALRRPMYNPAFARRNTARMTATAM